MTAAAGPRLGVTLYSFTPEWHAGEYSFAELIEKVAALRLGPGIEFVGFENARDFPRVDDAFVREFRTLVEKHGLEPACLDGQIDLGIRTDRLLTPDETFDYIVAQIDAAKKLGFPALRLQYGGFLDVAERLAPVAERAGVKLGVEIHSPHAVHHPTMMRLRELYAKIDSPYLGFVPDLGATTTGIPQVFLDGFQRRGVPPEVVELVTTTWNETRTSGDDPMVVREELRDRVGAIGGDEYAAQFAMFAFEYFGQQEPAAWNEIMPAVVHVHAKFFEIDETGEDPCVPYRELISVFRDGGYTGYLCSEYEGWQWEEADTRLKDGFELVAAHQRLCAAALEESASQATT